MPTITLTQQAVLAADHCLASVELTGAQTIALHNKVIQAVLTQCTQEVEILVDGKPAKDTAIKGGALSLDDAEFKHFAACVDKLVNFKVPGKLSRGYEDLMAAVAAGTPKQEVPAPEAEEKKPTE